MTDWLQYVAVAAAAVAAVASLVAAFYARRVEINTNSISHRLQKVAGLAGEAKGRDEERARGTARKRPAK